MGARQKQRGNEVNMHFTYCSHCGTKLIPKEIGDEGEIPFCINCNIPLWDMFTTCIIAAVVNENGEIALLRQNYVSATKYVCVAGIIKMGESAEETVIREVKEETGLDVSGCGDGYLFTYHRENPGEGDNYFVDVYRFVLDFEESDLSLQEEETAGYMLADRSQIEEFASQGIFLHYDSIKQAFSVEEK